MRLGRGSSPIVHWTTTYELITSRYPLLAKFLGGTELDEVVRNFLATYPPDGVAPSRVPERIPMFLARTAPWCFHPIIAELAAFDLQRSAALTNPDEPTVTRGDLVDAEPGMLRMLEVRLKKRCALIATQFRFHEVPIGQLRRDMPLDIGLTYLVVHVSHGKQLTSELDARSFLLLQTLVEGSTFPQLFDYAMHLGFEDSAADTFLARCVDSELFVASN